jgi:hypothetical protein
MRQSAILFAAAALVLAGCASNRPAAPAETPKSAAAQPGATPAAAPAPAAEAVPLPPPAAPPLTLKAGSAIVVRTTSALSSDKSESGASFTAHLEKPLVVDGVVVAPRGADPTGRVVEAEDGGRVKGLARLSLRLVSLVDATGRTREIRTSLSARRARATKKRDAAKIGIGAGIGAAIGAIAGGGKGAAIGAGSGGGAGTGLVLATKGEQVRLPAESVLRFTLAAPVTVSTAR